MDVFCFGDSITFGEFDTAHGGWVDRLKRACMARFIERGEPEVTVFNLGISGETSSGMRARFSAELATRVDPAARSIVTLAYGANDAAERGGALLVPREEYVDNLAWAIEEGRRLGCEVWLLSVTPIAPASDGARSPRSGRLRSNAVVSGYNDALRQLAHRSSAELVDVHAAFSARELSSLFTPDGVHPNAAGHALLCELVEERLLRR